MYHSAKTGLKRTTLLNCAIKKSGYKNKNRKKKYLKRITQFGLIKSLAGVNCKNCKFSANIPFSTENVQGKKMYKIFTRKQKETVSYINYIINECCALPRKQLTDYAFSGVFYFIGGRGRGRWVGELTETASGHWSDVSAFLGEAHFFSFHFFGKIPKGYDIELHGGGDAHNKCGFEGKV